MPKRKRERSRKMQGIHDHMFYLNGSSTFISQERTCPQEDVVSVKHSRHTISNSAPTALSFSFEGRRCPCRTHREREREETPVRKRKHSRKNEKIPGRQSRHILIDPASTPLSFPHAERTSPPDTGNKQPRAQHQHLLRPPVKREKENHRPHNGCTTHCTFPADCTPPHAQVSCSS